MRQTRLMKMALIAGLLAASVTTPVWAVNKVMLTNGREIVAKSVQWRANDQEYRVETDDGTVLPFPKAQIESIEIDKPAEYDKAAQLMAAKQYDAAIPALDEVVAKYAMLNWDNDARRLLATAYLSKNDAKKAAMTMDEYFVNVSKAEAPTDILVLYWTALLAADRSSALKKELEDAITSGGHEVACAAQLMHGDMNRKAGMKEAAFLDYMRTVELYTDVKAGRPEALFKAAEVLEELRDPRADQLRRRLARDFKDSEWAAKLGGKY